MPLQVLLDETKELGDKIEAALAADKSRNKKDRHANYKAKRISEATALWDAYQKKLKELKGQLQNPTDPCVLEAEKRYEAVYKQY